MLEKEIKNLIKDFINSKEYKIQLPLAMFNGIDIKVLVEIMNGFYHENLDEPLNYNKDFYLRVVYSIQKDETIVWIGKINK